MESWPAPAVPRLPGRAPTLRLFDSSSAALVASDREGGSDAAGIYVCGITPYDATHLGHAATYLAFDLVIRAWLDEGRRVTYVQNATDVDDPLLERAAATGEDWQELARREIALFREDMAALRVLPPEHYTGAVEAIPEIAPAIVSLLDAGAAYRLDDGTGDVYFAVASDPTFGEESRLDRSAMRDLFAQRGGDPERAGKRDPLDSLLWRGARDGEPAWTPEGDAAVLGPGRPGWHIECTVIALNRLGIGFEVQGGGSDLLFPHHEHSAAHGQVLTGKHPFAQAYVHAGMIGLDGEKMSKSRGNLVFVSKLRGAGVDPMAVRLALLDGHYRADREWTGGRLPAAERRLDRWRSAVALPAGPDAAPLVAAVRARLADDLDTEGAIADVDVWVDLALAGPGGSGAGGDEAQADDRAPNLVRDLVDARLGVAL